MIVRRGHEVVALFVVCGSLALTAACSQDVTSDLPPTSTATPERGTTAPAVDRTAELAADLRTLEAAFPLPTDSAWGSTGFVLGTETPAGWQPQSHRDSTTAVIGAGDRQIQIACAGSGSLTVVIEVRTADGTTTAGPDLSSGCDPQTLTSASTFTLPEDVEGVDVTVTPAGGAIAVAGYAIT